MKKIVLFLLLTANFIACKQNTNSIDKKTEKEEFILTFFSMNKSVYPNTLTI